MKSTLLVWALVGCVAGFAAEPGAAANSSSGKSRVGVYDSRAVAFAYFWSKPATQQRDALMAKAKSAIAVGDRLQFDAYSRRLAAQQKHSHLQVFSTEPADDAMAALADKLPALQQELGVSRFVSKWDGAALKEVAPADRVDVTERLTRELFTPDERQRRTLEQMAKSTPMPLEKARKLAEEEKM